VTDTDARLWHPWLRINRVLRVMLQTRWGAEAWLIVRVEFGRALALRPWPTGIRPRWTQVSKASRRESGACVTREGAAGSAREALTCEGDAESQWGSGSGEVGEVEEEGHAPGITWCAR